MAEFGDTAPLMGLTGSRQKAYDLTVSRQKRLSSLIFTVDRQKCKLVLAVKKFQSIANLTISGDLYGLLGSQGISKLEKPVRPVPMHVVRNTLSRYNKTLQLAYIRKYFKIL